MSKKESPIDPCLCSYCEANRDKPKPKKKPKVKK